MCFDLVSYFFLKLSKIDISENFENLQTADNRDERRPLSVLVSLDWSGRIEAEQQDDQDEDDWRYAHGFVDHRQKIAAARMPSRTPSNGLETTNQKETFQSEVVEFIFTLFSQAFEDGHFTERKISFETLNEVRRI
jgi:hypothetical protein